MSTEVASGRARRLSARQREGETVSALELFFDLVFVLGFTQCTALLADEPTWEGLAKGLLVLGVLSSRSSRHGAWMPPRPGASATRWHATPTRSCTCRWSRGSCSSRSG